MADEVNVRVTGDDEALRALRQVEDEARAEADGLPYDLAVELADKARANGRADRAPQTRLLVPTIDVEPTTGDAYEVVVGGSTRVGSRGTPAHEILFGAEFGSNVYKQFQRPHSDAGYWFLPAFETGNDVDREVDQAADDIERAFTRG